MREVTPFTPSGLERPPLYPLAGAPVTAGELPLFLALRKRNRVQCRHIFSPQDGVLWHLAWTASPLIDSAGQLLGIMGSVTCGPPEIDLQRMAELAHDLRTPLHALRLLSGMIQRD